MIVAWNGAMPGPGPAFWPPPCDIHRLEIETINRFRRSAFDGSAQVADELCGRRPHRPPPVERPRCCYPVGGRDCLLPAETPSRYCPRHRAAMRAWNRRVEYLWRYDAETEYSRRRYAVIKAERGLINRMRAEVGRPPVTHRRYLEIRRGDNRLLAWARKRSAGRGDV